MLKQKYFLTDFFILSAEKQPIKSSWRKIEWLLSVQPTICKVKNLVTVPIQFGMYRIGYWNCNPVFVCNRLDCYGSSDFTDVHVSTDSACICGRKNHLIAEAICVFKVFF